MPALPDRTTPRLRQLARQGGAIRDARRLAGLTQPKAAETLGVPLPTYQSWEYGTRGCPPEVRARIVAEWGGAAKILTGPRADACPHCHRPW